MLASRIRQATEAICALAPNKALNRWAGAGEVAVPKCSVNSSNWRPILAALLSIGWENGFLTAIGMSPFAG